MADRRLSWLHIPGHRPSGAMALIACDFVWLPIFAFLNGLNSLPKVRKKMVQCVWRKKCQRQFCAENASACLKNKHSCQMDVLNVNECELSIQNEGGLI